MFSNCLYLYTYLGVYSLNNNNNNNNNNNSVYRYIMLFALKYTVTFHGSHYSLMLALVGGVNAGKNEILLRFMKNVSCIARCM